MFIITYIKSFPKFNNFAQPDTEPLQLLLDQSLVLQRLQNVENDEN